MPKFYHRSVTGRRLPEREARTSLGQIFLGAAGTLFGSTLNGWETAYEVSPDNVLAGFASADHSRAWVHRDR
jgi:hypothetical protein